MPLKAVALDVDGTLTDGRFFWSAGGEETKGFHFADVMGISLAQKGGIAFALISGEDSPLVDRFAAKLGIAHVAKGCKDKRSALATFMENRDLSPSEVAFMGDDVNDLDAMRLAGFSAAPANAVPAVKAEVDFVSRRSGGEGAVREFLDYVLETIQLDRLLPIR